MSASAVTKGAHQIGLTVPNRNETKDFFAYALRFGQVGEVPAYPAGPLYDGTTMITHWQASAPQTAVPFDRKNVIGLHQFASMVDSLGTLEELNAKFREAGNRYEAFGPGTVSKPGIADRASSCGPAVDITVEL